MRADGSTGSRKAGSGGGLTPRLLPTIAGPVLIGYAALLLAGIWSYATLRIQSAYRSTIVEEGNDLRNVAAELAPRIDAMLNDGVGAAVAAANEISAHGGVQQVSDAQLSQTLANMLTGGAYVRSVFIATPGRFMRVGREGSPESASTPPAWLWPAFSRRTSESWVGAPIPDPEHPRESATPVARLVRHYNGDSWAGALIAFDRLDRLYRQVESDVSAIAMVSADGTILLRVPVLPDRDLRGLHVEQTDLFRKAVQAPPGVIVEGIAPYTGLPLVIAVNRVESYPILVGAMRYRDSMLASWRAERREILLLAAILTAVVVGMTWLLRTAVVALARREQEYRTLFNNAAFGAIVLEANRVVDANHTAESMFGVSRGSSLVGLAPWELSPEYQADGTLSRQRAQEVTMEALENGSASFDWVCKRLDSSKIFPCEVDISSLRTGGRTLILTVVHDVTERRTQQAQREQALAELREVAGTLIRVQDEDRRRIGRDLHDSTGQCLAVLELKLARLAAQPLAHTQRVLLEDCVELLDQCVAEIRTASYLLHPPLLDEIGLLSALRWLADGLRQRAEIDVRLELPGAMDRLPRDQELAIFRVAQEALTNVHRHSLSRTAVVRLFEAQGQAVLEVEDAGCGIDAEHDLAEGGVGLAGMRERMRQLGGTLGVRSGPTGTLVRAAVPIQRPSTGAQGRLASDRSPASAATASSSDRRTHEVGADSDR